MTMGDLFRCTPLMARRDTPSGSSAVGVNRRSRMASGFRSASSAGSAARSQASSSFLLVGCMASGAITAMQPRAAPNMPLTCRKGRASCSVVGRRSSCATRSFLCSDRQKSNSLGWRWRSSRASAMVARTSDSASCADSCARPLAALSFSSRKVVWPSSPTGHSMPSGRNACAVRTTSSRSQRPQPFCHSRAYGSRRLRHSMKRVTSSSKRIEL